MGLADQVVSSLTNLLAGIVIAASSDARTFGAYSLAFLGYTLLLGISTAYAGDPLTLSASHLAPEAVRRVAAASAGVPVLMGLAVLALSLPVLLDSDADSTLRTLAIVGACMPALLLHELFRQAFFAQRRAAAALIIDAVWLLTEGAVFAIGFWRPVSPSLLILGWAGGAAVGVLAGCFLLRPRIHNMSAVAWTREHAAIGGRFAVDFGVTVGAQQLGMLSATALGGLSDLGALRAAIMVVGPVSVLINGTRLISMPHWVRMREAENLRLTSSLVRTAVALGAACLVWGLVLLVVLPQYGPQLLGETWPQARLLLIPAVGIVFGRAIAAPPYLALRVLQAGQVLLRTRWLDAVVTVLGGTLGALVAGAEGCAIGLACANNAAAIFWWRSFLRANRASLKILRGPRVG